jgi:hypothetical protein
MRGEDVQTRRSSQGVMLQVAVLVKFDGAERPLPIQAFTLIVSAQGGVLESPVKITANQKITLENPKTGLSVRCRVVRADKRDREMFSVAFEFEKPGPHFWPIAFPSED